jgi:hypothetical protein
MDMKRLLPLLCFVPTIAHAEVPPPPPLEKLEVVELPPVLPQGAVLAPFVISGGAIIQLPVTDGGPIPARGGGFGMEFVGPVIGPMSSGSKTPGITWTFSISADIGTRCKEIQIEDVSGKETVMVARISNPMLDPGIVRLSSSTSEISEVNTPWLFEGGPTIKVFRITFTAPDGKRTVLHQPAWFSREAKAGLLGLINRIKNG